MGDASTGQIGALLSSICLFVPAHHCHLIELVFVFIADSMSKHSFYKFPFV